MLKRFGIEEGWFTLLLVWSLVIIAAAAIINAELISGLEYLPIISTVAVLSGTLLAKSRFSSRTSHFMALIYGLFLVVVVIGQFLPGSATWRDKVIDIFSRQIVWITKAISGESSRDGLIFVIQTSAIFWLLGYTAAWYTFRRQRIWRVVIPSGLVLLSVIYYYYGPKPLVGYLALYALVALVYVARTHLVSQEKQWRSTYVDYEKGIRFSFLQASLLAGLIALGLAWAIPTAQASAAVSNTLGESGVSGIWRDFQDNWTRLFSSLRSYGTGTSDAFNTSLSLGGPRTVGNTLIMDVYVQQRIPYVYWQAVAYDQYNDGTWTLSEGNPQLHLPDDGRFSVPEYKMRTNVQQEFINYLPNSGAIYGAPEVVNADRQLYVTQSTDPSGAVEVMMVQSRFVMRQGETYVVTSSYSIADATSLRQASQNYPAWIADKYLQVPSTITPETLQLATELTATYDNPFDKAIAVRDYLRNNIAYNDQIQAPPDNVDPVHYILFDLQEAYCNYYASAMIMMLRSQGVPARFVTGYAQGEWDEESSSYRVRANNAHAWVEVFFPEYGWIQFEPTAAIPAGDRPDNPSGNPGDPFAGLEENDTGGFGDEDLLPLDDLDRLPELADIDQESGLPLAEVETRNMTVPLIIGAVLLATASLLAVFTTRYNRQVEGNVDRSYARLANWGQWLGVMIRPAHTPYERASLLTASMPEGKAPVRNMIHQYVRQMFSPARQIEDSYSPKDDWRILRPLMIKRSIRHQLERITSRWR